MKMRKIDLKEITELSKELFHAHYAGNPEKWFSYLCTESIYLGTGEPLLFGGDTIREHFKGFEGKSANIVQEEYFPIALGELAAQVCGVIVVEDKKELIRVITHFTLGYRIINGEVKLVHQHNSYEYMNQGKHGKDNIINWDINTTQFVRNLLLEEMPKKRMAIHSGRQVIFVNPNMILYVQTQQKKTELVCVDKVISCNSTIGELAKELPAAFYPLHRGYLVNTLYIVAIRRFEVELLSGITLPIPAKNYMKIKQDLFSVPFP